jgi:two-component system chemotaxis sensor kinase CheA
VSGPDEFDPTSLLPEYVAECEEHLTSAGRVLLDLETASGRLDRDQLDGLFRNFHTVKGLSAMVGLHEAERLAHHLESYLGAVRKGRVALSPDGVTALVEGVKSLERVIAARGTGQPVPAVDALVGRVATLLPEDGPGAPASAPPPLSAAPEVAADPRARANAAAREGASVWRVRFTPSPARTERGLTVAAVRERLRAGGEIVHAEPVVIPGGVSFTFLVIGRAADFAEELRDDGLTVERYEPPPVDAPASTPPSAAARVASLTSANLVRVDLGRLDELMRTVGEMVITRARLDNGLGRVASALPPAERRELRETSLTLERQLRDLREGVMRVRLVPVRDVFTRMRFVVRDLARETGVEVDLHLTGENTEVDKFVVERLADPILHLIRNAVSHGLELPGERAAAGKPPRGRLDLRAAAAGGAIVIEVEDDGRGIDAERVFAQARAAGLVDPVAATDPAAVLDLLCSPGFSTRDGSDRASGRGVGMDVVARAVEDLGGTLALATQAGRGTKFTVRLPLTLAIADALIVIVAGQTFAVPQSAVGEVVEVEPGAPVVLENNQLLPHRGGVVPLIRLADLFGLGGPAGAFVALVVGDGGAALGVDRVLGVREIVVRPLADPLVQVPGISGATELGDGRAVLILDAAGLARHARSARRPRDPSGR